MTRVMLLAVLDTLLPGDESEPPLPSASEAALDLKNAGPPGGAGGGSAR